MCNFNLKRAENISFNGFAVADIMENFVIYMSINGEVNKTYTQTKINRVIECLKHFAESKEEFTTENVNAYMSNAYKKFAPPSQRLYAGAIAQFIDYCLFEGLSDKVDAKAVRKHICEVFTSDREPKRNGTYVKRVRKSEIPVVCFSQDVINRYAPNEWDDFEMDGSNWKCWV